MTLLALYALLCIVFAVAARRFTMNDRRKLRSKRIRVYSREGLVRRHHADVLVKSLTDWIIEAKTNWPAIAVVVVLIVFWTSLAMTALRGNR